MLIRMNQLSRLYRSSEYLHFAVPLDWHAVGMAHAHTPSERLKACVFHFIDIWYGPIDYGPNTAERFVNIAIHFTPERAY